MIAITSDIDWAPEPVIIEMLEIFEKYNTKCTLFVTHESKAINQCNRDLFEIAIHPNFNDKLFDNSLEKPEETIDKLMGLYPEAKGVRSHSMTQSTLLLDLFSKKKLIYESNTFIPYSKNLEPIKLWNGLIRIPYNWEDDMHWLYNKSFDFDILKGYKNESMIILDFHPIHVFLNTDSQATYERAKPFYQNSDKLIGFKNKKKPGVRDFLIRTLKEIEKREISNYKLIELVN
tara:strand:- start:1255 stop:1950 length:696 start_codon:yes stop_codon:yes gene_type:complete